MFLKRLFSPRRPPAAFTADLGGEEAARLEAEFLRCLDRDGGALATSRLLEALAELFDRLSPDGRRVFAHVVATIDRAAKKTAGDRYTRIEESEYFGRASTKLAILDAFEPPRMRLLRMLRETDRGPALLAALREAGESDLAADIESIGGETG